MEKRIPYYITNRDFMIIDVVEVLHDGTLKEVDRAIETYRRKTPIDKYEEPSGAASASHKSFEEAKRDIGKKWPEVRHE